MSNNGYIVAGTDTDVGKTVFAAALTRALEATYYKPVQAGTSTETDTETVACLSGRGAGSVLPEAYRLKMAASPHLAAAAEGIEIDCARLQVLPTTSPLIVELAGGVMVPLTPRVVFIDIIGAWDLPVILCARTSLGTINHTLLTLEALRNRRIPIAGIAFIGQPQPEVEATITELSAVARLGRLPFIDPLTPDQLLSAFNENFDVGDLLRAKESA